MDEPLVSGIAADAIVLAAPELDRSQGREVLGVLWNFDQLFRLHTIRDLNLALLPHARDVGLPGFAHASDEAVGAAEQQHMWAQRVSTGQDAEVLQHDRFE